MRVNKIGIAPIAVVMIAGTTSAQDMRGARPASPSFAEQAALCRVDEHIDGQLGYLEAELKITEAQTAQWNVFADAFRADKEKQAQACKTTQEQVRSMASAALPDSMKIMADRLSARLESYSGNVCGDRAALRELEPGTEKEGRRDYERCSRHVTSTRSICRDRHSAELARPHSGWYSELISAKRARDGRRLRNGLRPRQGGRVCGPNSGNCRRCLAGLGNEEKPGRLDLLPIRFSTASMCSGLGCGFIPGNGSCRKLRRKNMATALRWAAIPMRRSGIAFRLGL